MYGSHALATTLAFLLTGAAMTTRQQGTLPTVRLPAPRRDNAVTLDSALRSRRSVREFSARPLSVAEAGQLLWAAQGSTSGDERRTVPSAGALYPIEVYLVVGRVQGLEAGVYHYDPRGHSLAPVRAGDHLRELASAAVRQDWMEDAAAVIAITAVYQRTARRYGERAPRYVHMEVGHAAQNVYLEAAALGLGTTMVGAFDDARVARVLGLPTGTEPLGLLPVGRPR